MLRLADFQAHVEAGIDVHVQDDAFANGSLEPRRGGGKPVSPGRQRAQQVSAAVIGAPGVVVTLVDVDQLDFDSGHGGTRWIGCQSREGTAVNLRPDGCRKEDTQPE
ncbi:MAG: hypothetical protein U0Q18_30020 [Bryobacteraceae bacterium]